MNKDEIKKALRCCKEQACCDCPHWCEMGCRYQTLSDALALITEQENEIERLRTTLGQCNTELNSALESLKSQCREIGELKAGTKQAKIDVLNELKQVIHDDIFDQLCPDCAKAGASVLEQIDDMIEELKK